MNSVFFATIQNMAVMAISAILGIGFWMLYLRTRRSHFLILFICEVVSVVGQALYLCIIIGSILLGHGITMLPIELIMTVSQIVLGGSMLIGLVGATLFLRDEMRRAGAPQYDG